MAENYQKAEDPQDPSAYFLAPEDDLENVAKQQKINKIFGVIRYYAVKIWPSVQRVIRAVVYFTISLIKSTVNIAKEQIKNMGGS